MTTLVRTEGDGDSLPCPWCGNCVDGLFEYNDGDVIECEGCCKDFQIHASYSVTYAASRPAEET